MKSLLQTTDRILQLATGDIAAAPAANTEPHFISSPTVGGLPTRGFGVVIVAPSAGAAAAIGAGFSLTVYRLIPTLGVYASGLVKTGIQFSQQFVNYDLSGAQGWYFVIDAATVAGAGNILLCFTELP